ncbi:hydrophobin 5 [Linnemannia elongata AG-77]|uniref:Hydrophobin 5 n=1 Tax=Linnemannia elongata AG-77 TaxID=1314771 RepID=A0A197JB92_9FUNG|nr:hydrophobin 5 [Linnemannia elongata AG-77]
MITLSLILATFLVSTVLAGGACPDLLYSIPTCCSTDVLGLADLSCSTPKSASSGSDLKSSCASDGKAAKCCTPELLEIGVLCQDPVGA